MGLFRTEVSTHLVGLSLPDLSDATLAYFLACGLRNLSADGELAPALRTFSEYIAEIRRRSPDKKQRLSMLLRALRGLEFEQSDDIVC
jgi:hypothetical protein